MSRQALDRLREQFGLRIVNAHEHRGDETAQVAPGALREACLWLRDDPEMRFDMLTDLTAVDHLEQGRTPRFDVVYHVYSVSHRHRLRLKVALDAPEGGIATVSDIWCNANWLEREVWDMYGIRFADHPDLRRILLYESFEGHPLRKDYPKERRQPLIRRPQHEIDGVLERKESTRSLL